jgi:hypothetical protein
MQLGCRHRITQRGTFRQLQFEQKLTIRAGVSDFNAH